VEPDAKPHLLIGRAIGVLLGYRVRLRSSPLMTAMPDATRSVIGRAIRAGWKKNAATRPSGGRRDRDRQGLPLASRNE
jgi:hypothetical protein